MKDADTVREALERGPNQQAHLLAETRDALAALARLEAVAETAEALMEDGGNDPWKRHALREALDRAAAGSAAQGNSDA